MDSALPNETLVVALSLAAARILVYAAGYCLFSQNDLLKRSLRLGQLLISIFLCCATAVAVYLAYGRFKDAYVREAVSFIFVSLIGAESHRRAMLAGSRKYEALLILAYFFRMTPLLSGFLPEHYFPLFTFLPLSAEFSISCYEKAVSEGFQWRVLRNKCYVAVGAILILLIVTLMTNYERPSSSGLVVGLAIDFLLLLLLPYDIIDSWISVQDHHLASQTDIELNRDYPSESEIPIREDEPRLRTSEQASQKNQETDRPSADSALNSFDRNTFAEECTVLALTTVRLRFSDRYSKLEICLRAQFPEYDAVPIIVALGSQQFDVAVSEAARHRLMATTDSFQILQTRLTEDDPLIIKFGALHASSRMLARYMQIVPGEQAKTWHAGSIQDLRDKVTQSIESAFSQNGFLENLRSNIASSPKCQDIYVGLLCLFVGHTHLIYRSNAHISAMFIRVERDNEVVRIFFDAGDHQIHFKVFWSTTFRLATTYGIHLRSEICPQAASILQVQA